MFIKIFSCAGVATFLCSSTAFAFDVVTHAAMTGYAVEQSAINTDPDFLRRLGIWEMVRKDPTAPFRVAGQTKDVYVVVSSKEYKTGLLQFEQDTIEIVSNAMPEIPRDHSIKGWMMRGVVREDDNSKETPFTDESPKVMDRVFSHFFDPFKDRPFTPEIYSGPLTDPVAIPFAVAKAPDWALNPLSTSKESFGSSEQRANNYNGPAAREAMWRALRKH